MRDFREGSLSADLGTRERAATSQIADVFDHPNGRDDAGSVDVSEWDFSAIARQEIQLEDHFSVLSFSPFAAGCWLRLQSGYSRRDVLGAAFSKVMIGFGS